VTTEDYISGWRISEDYTSLLTLMKRQLIAGFFAGMAIALSAGIVQAQTIPPLAAADTYLPNPPTENVHSYIYPAHGVFTSGYGPRWGRMHRGIDIAAAAGTPIVAAAAGRVEFVGTRSGYGLTVEVRHPDGSMTRYAHNRAFTVAEGQEVEQGQQIAEMGSTGHSTGVHCHFEIHPVGEAAVNPLDHLPPIATLARR